MCIIDLSGRTCLVTGASSGIGKETARELARMGATVILACRNAERGDQARSEIVQDTGNHNVELMRVDLSCQDSIRTFARDFVRTHNRLHVLVNNAGIYAAKRILTVDGLESTFAVNHLAYFLLTNLLLDLLKASAPARIVNVASEAQRRGRIDFDDLQGERKYSGLKAYAQSKLANVIFTYELARRLEGAGVVVNCLHPGMVYTNFGHDNGGFMSIAMRVFGVFMLSPSKGAQTSIYLVSSPAVEGVTGKYFIKKSEAKSSRDSYDRTIARQLWNVSSELTKLNLV